MSRNGSWLWHDISVLKASVTARGDQVWVFDPDVFTVCEFGPLSHVESISSRYSNVEHE